MFEGLVAPAAPNLLEEPDDSDSTATEALLQSFAEMSDTYQSFSDLDVAAETVTDLDHLIATINAHGVTTSLRAFSNRDNLLSSAMPAFAACESLGDVGADAAESVAVQQELTAANEALLADWFKKTWDAIVGFAGKAGSFAKAAYDKVASAAKWVAGKTFDAAKAAKETVKAHPIATAVTAVAIVAAIGTALFAIWGLPLPASAITSTQWAGQVRDKLLNALGSHGFKVDGLNIDYPAGFGVEEVKTAGALGYTASSSNALITSAEEVTKSGSVFARLGETISAAARKLFEAVKAAKDGGAGFARKAWRELIRITLLLWRFLTSKAVMTITSAVNVIRGLFVAKEPGKELVPA